MYNIILKLFLKVKFKLIFNLLIDSYPVFVFILNRLKNILGQNMNFIIIQIIIRRVTICYFGNERTLTVEENGHTFINYTILNMV